MSLNDLRDKLDILDENLLEVLNERMQVVKEVGKLKAKEKSPIYRPEREQEILNRLNGINSGVLNQKAIEAIFLEIFAISRNLELPENIAFLGPIGSFTHQAAESRFGAMSSYLSINSITGVFEQVATSRAKYGVIPIENSSNGIVNDTFSALSNYNLKIIAEVALDIHHCLATNEDEIKNITRIYSKDIAFEQCYNFLKETGLHDNVELIPVESTAKAAQLAKGKKNSAAICSNIAAKIYDLPLLFENIEDHKKNRTRFLIISDFENQKAKNSKTTILVTLPNSPGSLVEFLNDFDKAKINLTKIKSHITGGISKFFVDFDGHQEDENIVKIFEKHKQSIKFLGSYIKEIEDI